MYQQQDIYFSGQGEVLIAERNADGTNKGFIVLGNVPELKIGIEPSVLEHKESRSGNRSTDKRIQTELKVTASLILENLNKENLAIALRATSTALAGASVTDFPLKFKPGKIMALGHAKVSAVTIEKSAVALVAYNPASPATPWDYKLNADFGSIEFSATPATGTLVLDDNLTVDYTYAAQTQVEALLGAPKDYTLRFEGLNTANENKPVIVEVHSFATDPLRELSLISDAIGQFQLEGSVYPDATKGEGLSKYFRQTLV